jgi:hypothetical protein
VIRAENSKNGSNMAASATTPFVRMIQKKLRLIRFIFATFGKVTALSQLPVSASGITL